MIAGAGNETTARLIGFMGQLLSITRINGASLPPTRP